jgi:omega-6 fatty acid desaturase (delta-12 desaturase)
MFDARAHDATAGAIPGTTTSGAERTARPPVRERDGSLNAVRAVIPASCYERPTGRALWTLAQAAVLYLAPVVGLALTDRWWLLIALWPLAGLGVSGLFVLGHDASHGALLRSRRANLTVARMCMLPSLHLESAWDLGHNRIHHGYTTREGFDFVWHPLTVEQYRALGRLDRLRHRLEWSWLGSGAYFLRSVWWNKMLRFRGTPTRRRALVVDKVIVGAVAVTAVTAMGTLGAVTGGLGGAVWTPVKVLVVPFLVFAQIIGFTVYVHHVAPDIRWWRRRQWSQFKGQMESTTVLRTPRLLNTLWLHNIFVHVPHHVDVRIPFHELPVAAQAITDAFPDTVRSSRLSLRAYLRTTRRCKLYDFERGAWLPYAPVA